MREENVDGDVVCAFNLSKQEMWCISKHRSMWALGIRVVTVGKRVGGDVHVAGHVLLFLWGRLEPDAFLGERQ